MKSLKYKITIPVLIFVMIGIILLSGVAYYQAKEAIVIGVKEMAQSKVEKLAALTNDQIHEWEAIIGLLATVDAVKNIDHQGLKIFIDQNKKNFEVFEAIILSDKDGKYANTNGQGGNLKDREYFQKVMTGQSAVSNPVISKTTGNPIVVIAVPIKDDNGNIIGLIGGTVNLDYITKVVNTEKLGKTGYAYMIDQEGLVMAHPKKEMILQFNVFEKGDNLQIEIAKKMIKGEKGVDTYQFDGQEKLLAYAPISSMGWSIGMTAYYSEVTEGVSKFKNMMMMMGVAMIIVIGMVIYFLINRSIQPVLKMAEITKEVATGNLTVNIDVKTEDEIGMLANNFNHMIKNMRNLLSEMDEMGMTVASTSQQMMASTEEASTVSEQVANTISELAEGASEQAQSIHRSSDMVNELITGIGHIAKNTNNTDKLTVRAKETVDAGMQIVAYQKSKTIENKQVTINVGEEISALSEKSQQIGQIVALISSIAEQTNLLALNAAIEAARAGEQGKGFAVVAEEVRKLAEESGKASQNIHDLIYEIQNGVGKAVKEMDQVKIVVDEQENAVENTVNVFENILKAVGNVAENIKEVSKSCEKLNEDAVVVGGNIDNISGITQTNAAAAEEVAASTEEQSATIEELSASAEKLASLSGKLQESIQKFKI
ncbi:methyl-accepting chemotaxis protein [Marinisporobacter balticus]|uniref:Methyl-accepting chemotaxis sensory transducer with Cache sensor n=1 Tax=Marinisporobacter balticus TaxID=2018667 RepID=A0A4R2KSN7_9FIRM|nr:methyl-accepting chemotaxis protein [Marinisporobacter balticus]TCO69695.1 methyl-accepting chemotaxis sensory transducer with Cache sensor [Marinisporobacter balticus]